MFNWTATIVIAVVVLMAALAVRECDTAPAFQELEHRDGYVPVYIRVGDTPLNEINPKLAEAFGAESEHTDVATREESESKSSEDENEPSTDETPDAQSSLDAVGVEAVEPVSGEDSNSDETHQADAATSHEDESNDDAVAE